MCVCVSGRDLYCPSVFLDGLYQSDSSRSSSPLEHKSEYLFFFLGCIFF